MIANEEIEISIDLPLHRLRAADESAESSQEEDEEKSLELLSPRASAVPQADGKLSSAGRGKLVEEQEGLAQRGEGQGSNDKAEEQEEVVARPGDSQASEGEQPKRRAIPCLCRLRLFRTCRLLCFRDPNKPRQSCSQILCPRFLSARAEATRFKMSWPLLVEAEKKV